MKPFPCQDLSGQNRNISCQYHGKELIDGEGILNLVAYIKGSIDESNLEVGINLHRDNIPHHRFNGRTNSLDLWVSRKPERMYMVEPSSLYPVPKLFEVKAINVYDKE